MKFITYKYSFNCKTRTRNHLKLPQIIMLPPQATYIPLVYFPIEEVRFLRKSA